MGAGSKGALVVLFWLLATLAGRTIDATNEGSRLATKPPVAGLMRGSATEDLSAPATTASHKTSSTTLKSVSESQRRSQPTGDGSKRSRKAATLGKPMATAVSAEALRIDRRDGQNGANLPELTLEEDTSESYLSDDTSLDLKGNPTLSSVLGDEGHTLTSTPEYESDGSEIVDSLSDTSSTPPTSLQQQVSASNQLKAQQQQIAQLRSQLAASNTQMSHQRPSIIRNNNQAASQAAVRNQHHALLADARNLLMAARQPVSLTSGHQQAGLPAQPSSPVSTFNLNMGADRMMIKQQPRSQLDNQELATESIQHELMTSQDLPSRHLHDHDRRQAELMYAAAAAAAAAGSGLDNNQQPAGPSTYGDSPASIIQQPPTCYSPLALLMVILTTMLVTLLACLVTHLLIKHLSRHQFDLIANSKRLETKHAGFGSPERRNFDHQGSRASLWAASTRDPQSRTSSVLNMLINQRPVDNQNPSSAAKQLQRLDQQQQQAGCAFDNPYFREESWPSATGHRATNRPSTAQSAAADETGPTSANVSSANLKQSWRASSSSSSEHLNFIESHISNLHSRQVTSSVKELSVLNNNTAPQVVDLTCEEQRARVMADPKEGDLVAVDISGHDFMGLGFDVCGNAQQGIFVRSVLSRGPARDSGCIQPGDRLKCINISFDQMTLQDACDILNSGSPYKLRLLIEKRAAPPKLADKFRQTAPILLRRNHRSQSHLLNQHHYLNTNNNNHSSSQLQFNGSFSFKSCLRRLTDMFTGSNKKQTSSNGQLDYRTSQFGVRSPVAGASEFLEQPPMYLGSAAARRHFPQTRPDSASLFGTHMNAADYPGAGSAHLADTDDDEGAAFDDATMRAASGDSAKPTTDGLFCESSSTSSVNVPTAGANQRLNKLTSQDLAAKQHHTTLSTKRSQQPDGNHHHQNSPETPASRRQSLVALNESSSQALKHQAYLKQTHSQPEMSRQSHKMAHSDTFARAGKLGPADRGSGDDVRRNKS